MEVIAYIGLASIILAIATIVFYERLLKKAFNYITKKYVKEETRKAIKAEEAKKAGRVNSRGKW